MHKIWEFQCTYCNTRFEQFIEMSEIEKATCPKCDSQAKLIPSFGGYSINGDNSASVRPKSAGSFKRKK